MATRKYTCDYQNVNPDSLYSDITNLISELRGGDNALVNSYQIFRSYSGSSQQVLKIKQACEAVKNDDCSGSIGILKKRLNTLKSIVTYIRYAKKYDGLAQDWLERANNTTNPKNKKNFLETSRNYDDTMKRYQDLIIDHLSGN